MVMMMRMTVMIISLLSYSDPLNLFFLSFSFDVIFWKDKKEKRGKND